MTVQIQELDVLLDEIEDVIESITIETGTSDATGFVVLPHLEQLEHLGVYVEAPETRDTEQESEARGCAWERDRVQVTLLFGLERTGTSQRALRGEAIRLEQLLRRHLTAATALAPSRPRRLVARRRKRDGRWLEIVQLFTYDRNSVPSTRRL